jgi:arginase family enzyme
VRPILLLLDEALERQPALAAAVAARDGGVVRAQDLAPQLRLWSRPPALAALRKRLAQAGAPCVEAEVVFAGSGDFHHVTLMLLERALARAAEPITVVHFDNHPDWARRSPGLHCGGWVCRAARLPGVAGVVSIGLTSADIAPARARQGDLALVEAGRLELFPWASDDGAPEMEIGGRGWPTIAGMGETQFIERLAASIRTRTVYITIDKDVLAWGEAVTNWDQGVASLDFLEEAVRGIVAGRRLAGADVVGDWSPASYGHGPSAWLKRAEAWLDQPHGEPEPLEADAINQRANLRLLRLFEEAAA